LSQINVATSDSGDVDQPGKCCLRSGQF